MNIYYVYIYYDGDEPFYVGIGNGRRYLDHIKEARKVLKANLPRNKLSHKLNKIINILNAGKEPTIIKVEQHLALNDARAKEVALISDIGRADLGTGPLTNQTPGGEGVVGRTTMVSPNGDSISILKEDRPTYEALGYVHFNKGRKHSEEVNKRKAAPWTGGTRPDHGAKVRKAAEEGRFKNRKSRGPHTETTRQKMRAPKKKRDGYLNKRWYHSVILNKEAATSSMPDWPDVALGRLKKIRP